LLGDGSAIGCKFSYAEQAIPNGLAQVCYWRRIYDDDVAFEIGDNIFLDPICRSCSF
jgi:glucose-1-phosphate thymidylyltransferase